MMSCRPSKAHMMMMICRQQSRQQQQKRSLFVWTTVSSSSSSSPWQSISGLSSNEHDNVSINRSGAASAAAALFQYQQVRWKRRDGNRFQFQSQKQKPSSKKQRKRYNIAQKQERLQREKHNPPGSRAAIHKQYLQEFEDWSKEEEEEDGKNRYKWTPERLQDYTMQDAMLDDFMNPNNNKQATGITLTPIPQYVGHLQQSLFNQVADQMEEYRLAKTKNLQIQQQLQQLQLQLPSSSSSSSATTTMASKGDTTTTTITSPAAAALVEEEEVTVAAAVAAVASEWNDNIQDLLPTDTQISLALRAYRDKHGTRQKPIGLVRALSHLVKDLDIPMSSTSTNSSPPSTTVTSKKKNKDSSSDDSMAQQQEQHRGWGEYTYTTLLTCCHTPAEGRRVFQIMKEQQHPLSSYSWNILMDLHAKVGDYEGCIAVQEEMMAHSGIRPTVVSYTTILAACYKVCVDTSRIPHDVRSKAAKMAWTKGWQEMRIAGIHPDVMAYGAMLRILAVTGQPERAINLLEEMLQQQQQDPPIQPTTLCFTSALKAVAKSHAMAIRFERASSRRNTRREFITAHHGKLAQQIVILAEQFNVSTQDDGFIAALVSCAAAAGDVATAKAIYVAHQIRRECDFLRTIGPNEHLEQLNNGGISSKGNNDETTTTLDLIANEENFHLQAGTSYPTGEDFIIMHDDDSGGSAIDAQGASTSSSSTPTVNSSVNDVDRPKKKKKRTHQDKVQLFQEREYGKDSRVISAILHACATAADPNGMGTLWQGRENHGYLCINSLRLLTARRVPRYSDESIPGATRTDNLTWHGESKDDDYRNGKRTQGRSNAKSRANVYVDENGASTMDDLDDSFRKMFLDKNGQRKPQYQRLTFEDVWKLKYHHDQKEIDNNEHVALQQAEGFVVHNSNSNKKKKKELTKALSSSSSSSLSFEEPNVDDKQEELYFCYDSMRWEKRPKAMFVEQVTPEVVGDNGMNQDGSVDDRADSRTADHCDDDAATFSDEEMYFDNNLMRWSTRPKVVKSSPATTRTTTAGVEMTSPKQTDDVLYFDKDDMKWKTRPRLESEASGLNEFEAKVLLGNDKHDTVVSKKENERTKSTDEEALFAEFYRDLKNEMEQSGEAIDNATEEEARQLFFALRDMGDGGDIEAGQDDMDFMNETDDDTDSDSDSEDDGMENEQRLAKIDNTTEAFEVAGIDDYDAIEVDEELVQLRQMLPAFSDKRLRKIQKTFHGSLHDPSLLELALVVRESMPDYITNTWLKQMSLLTAKHVVAKAAQDGLVDIHVLNNVLELEAAVGSLDRALEFHQTEYKKYRLTPNGFSDRLVVQMFLKHNRFQRALAFKEKVEDASRSLDIPSYGSLVDYCARHNQLGSALILLKECIDLHGSPPPEASLSQLRILCRQHDLVDELHLTKLIGKDPTEWLRHGEAHLKREMSKRGRRDVRLARNILVQA